MWKMYAGLLCDDLHHFTGSVKIFFIGEVEETKISIESSTSLETYIKENERVIHIDEIKEKSGLKEVYEFFRKNEFELIVPLRFKERINGILCLKRKEEEFGSEYTEDEKRYINIIAGFTSVAMPFFIFIIVN